MTTSPPSAATNLADVVRATAAGGADRPALISAAGTRTWGELDRAADAGAAAMAARPVGDRVVLALPTGADLAAALFAVLRAGLVAVPVDPRRTDLAWVARRVGAGLAITDEAEPGTAAVLRSGDIASWWAAGTPALPARVGGEALAMLARSARSGPPVMLSHRAFVAAAAALRGAPLLAVRPEDRILQVLPLFHVVGLVTAFLPAAVAGAAVVVPGAGTGRLPAEAALEAVRAHRVTILPAEPTLYRQLDRVPDFARALSTVRLMTSGSSPLDPADFTAVRAATGQTVREGYGISESAAAITSTLMTPAAHPGSVGLPYPGVEVRIVGGGGPGEAGGAGPVETLDGSTDPASTPSGTDAAEGSSPDPAAKPPGATEPAPGGLGLDDDMLADASEDGGDVGPIAIRGDTLFSGYWPDGHGGPGPDGWYVTGDIGYTDDAGELHLVDRAGETVVVAGFTVYPREVEDVLVSHPYVADAAVVGVPGRGGETVVAVLVAQPGTRPTPDDLDEYVAARLAPFKRPTGYQVVEVLPRTEVGRLDRETARRGYALDRGIPLDAPAHLRAAVGGTRPAAATGDIPGALRGDAPAADVAPEAAAGLDRLGAQLPSPEGRGSRSARDTDEDLF